MALVPSGDALVPSSFLLLLVRHLLLEAMHLLLVANLVFLFWIVTSSFLLLKVDFQFRALYRQKVHGPGLACVHKTDLRGDSLFQRKS